MSIPGVTFVSREVAVNLVASRLAQLDQAITILGPQSVLGTYLGETRQVWAGAQRTLAAHAQPSECGDGVECLHSQVVTATPKNPWREAAADELMVALVGVQRSSQLIGLLIRIVTNEEKS